MNIFLDKKLEDFIDDTKKNYKKGMEFEIRISDNKNKTAGLMSAGTAILLNGTFASYLLTKLSGW